MNTNCHRLLMSREGGAFFKVIDWRKVDHLQAAAQRRCPTVILTSRETCVALLDGTQQGCRAPKCDYLWKLMYQRVAEMNGCRCEAKK